MNTESRDRTDLPDELHRRLEGLPSLIDDDPQFVHRVLSRIEADDIVMTDVQSFQIRRWIMRSSLGLATGVVVSLFAWHLLFNAPRRAIAMEQVSKRVLSLDSLHLKGEIFPSEGGPPQPLEIFLKKPGLCRTSGPVGGLKGITETIITPEQQFVISSAAMQVTITPGNPQDAKAQVEQILQSYCQMMFGQGTGFKRVRSEKLDAATTDVYESQVTPGWRVDVWLNIATELPVKSEMWMTRTGKPSALVMRFNTIEANPVIAADVFAPKFGPAWTVSNAKAPAGADMVAIDQVRFGRMALGVRYAMNLGRGDLLICWHLYDTTDLSGDLKGLPDLTSLTFKGADGSSFTEHLLHADAVSAGFHWRWSLLRPEKASSESVTVLSVVAKDNTGSSGTTTISPLIYSAKELAEHIETLQKQTLPRGQPPMTLDQILAAGKR